MSADHRSDEAGLSLVELLVVMVIFGLVGSIATAGMIRGMRTSDQVQDRVAVMGDLHQAAARVSRELRAACPVSVATPYRVQATIFRNGERLRYTYETTAATDALREVVHVWNASASPPAWSATPRSDRRFIQGVLNADLGRPVFKYFDRDGNVTADARRVHRVKIELVRDLRDRAPLELATSVNVRNSRNGAQPCPS